MCATSVLTCAPVLTEASVLTEDPVQAGDPVLLLTTESWNLFCFCSCRRSCRIMTQELWQNHAPVDLWWYHIFVLVRAKRINLIWFCIWFGDPKYLYRSQPCGTVNRSGTRHVNLIVSKIHCFVFKRMSLCINITWGGGGEMMKVCDSEPTSEISTIQMNAH